jgi:hypothetical protein
MRVRIVSYEDVNAWILGKFARKLNEELMKLGVDSDISNVSDPDADFNHHIIYMCLDASKGDIKDTLMVTHIDDYRKLNLLKKQLQTASLGICMSFPLMSELIIGGIPKDKLCYINPAHDGIISVKPYIIGITSQVKPDGCKREHLVEELSEYISPQLFHFKIMGSGWERVIQVLRNRGFQVDYQSEFIYDEYTKLIPSLDYYFYMGQDEGSMGYIDALAAGVKTIVTPQGFHLDADHGITYPFNTLQELVEVFNSLSQEKRQLIDSVKHWTWRDYAIKHLEIWNYLSDPIKLKTKSIYKDGLNSMLSKESQPLEVKKLSYYIRLYKGAWKRTIYRVKTGLKIFETFKRKFRSLFGTSRSKATK